MERFHVLYHSHSLDPGSNYCKGFQGKQPFLQRVGFAVQVRSVFLQCCQCWQVKMKTSHYNVYCKLVIANNILNCTVVTVGTDMELISSCTTFSLNAELEQCSYTCYRDNHSDRRMDQSLVITGNTIIPCMGLRSSIQTNKFYS